MGEIIVIAAVIALNAYVLHQWRQDREEWKRNDKEIHDIKDKQHNDLVIELNRLNHETTMYLWELKSALQAHAIPIPKAPWDEDDNKL